MVIDKESRCGTDIHPPAHGQQSPNVLGRLRHTLISIAPDVIDKQTIIGSEIESLPTTENTVHTAFGKCVGTVVGIALVTIETIESPLCTQPYDSLPVLLDGKNCRRVGQSVVVEPQRLGIDMKWGQHGQ